MDEGASALAARVDAMASRRYPDEASLKSQIVIVTLVSIVIVAIDAIASCTRGSRLLEQMLPASPQLFPIRLEAFEASFA
eukprot:7579300-Pyramimonas_sp.AAC.1